MPARRSPLLLLALVLCLALVAATGANATDGPSQRLFMRRSACVDATDQLYLSTVVGTEASCGDSAAITPMNEVVHQVDGAGFSDAYATVDALSYVADASRPISGAVTLSSYKGAAANPLGLGVGQTAIDVVVTGETASDSYELGRTTIEYVATPDKPETKSTFSLPLDPTLDGQTFTSFTLTTIVRGAHALHGFMVYSGKSYLDVPTKPEVEPTEAPVAP